MSEVAPSAPQDEPEVSGEEADEELDDEGGGGGGGRGCLPVLIGVFLLLAGVWIGTMVGKRLAPAETTDPTTEPVPVTGPSDAQQAALVAKADRPPVELHYLVVCGGVRDTEARLDLLGVMAEIQTPALPSKGHVTVAMAISAANRDRRFAIRGFYADGTSFLEEELELNPRDPRRPYPNLIRVPVELTTPDPLVFEVFTDDKYLLGRRVIPVRIRPTTGPTTEPTSGPSTEATSGATTDEPPTQPAAEPSTKSPPAAAPTTELPAEPAPADPAPTK